MNSRLTVVLLLALCAGSAHSGPEPGQGFVDVPGGPVWYQVTGNGDGAPLLVLHGGPGGTSCGYALLDPLGVERPVIRYDQLGTGRSGRPDDPSLWTVERYVEELHVLRQSLGLDEMHLLGHSWGAALAAAYVLEKGTDGLRSVTLSSPLLSTPRWIADANYLRSKLPDDVQQTLSRHEAAGTTDSEDYAAATEVFYERHVYGGLRGERPAECKSAPWSQFVYEYMWGPTEFHATGTLIDFDVTDRLHTIDVPVLFMTGEFDEARPETVAEFRDLVPGARLEVLPGVAHASMAGNKEQYMRILERFLDDVDERTIQ